MTPRQAHAPHDWEALLCLIRDAFAYMDGRIDPPSSMHHLSAEAIARQADTGEVWVIEQFGRPVACVFLTPKGQSLYVGKLAVVAEYRGKGLARRLIETAEARARALGFPALELQVRVELVENQAAFTAMGFVKTAETAHEGFDRPTSFTYRKRLRQDAGL